jgi:hypothetical protein
LFELTQILLAAFSANLLPKVMRLHVGKKASMAFWIFLLLVNLIMGFLIGYCFRAANEPRRQKPKTSA